MTFAICNLEKTFSTWWKTIGRSVGRWPVTTGQKRGRQDQRRADRSAWRHRARRVKAGRSVSRLFDTIMLQSCETPALRRDTHRSLFVTSHIRPLRKSVVRKKKKKDDYFERNAEIWYSWCEILSYAFTCPASTSRVRPDIRNLCHEMKKSKMIYTLFAEIFAIVRCESDGKYVIQHKNSKKSVCSRWNSRADGFDDLNIITLKLLWIFYRK